MARLVEGDDNGLNAIMARYSEPIFHYLIRVLHSEDEATDLAQETFVRVYQNCARFRRNSKFSTWLYTIATNLARDRWRYLNRHPQVSLDAESRATGEAIGALLPSDVPSPDAAALAEERARAVRGAISALPEDLRSALILAEYEEKSLTEIAEILGCSAKGAEMRLYRARQNLRSKLARVLQEIQ